MITQIYSIQTVQEALDCIEAQADYIGVAVATGANLPSEVSFEKCAQIYQAIGSRAKKVLIVVSKEENIIFKALETCHCDVLHLCGYDFKATPQFVNKVKALYPNMQVLQAIGMIDESAINEALYFSKFCDEIILDSVDKSINGIGAAGFTNDWDLAAKIVKLVDCKVILAGGLSKDNVKDAILKVKPWGVDSFTKTSDLLADGKSRKNKDKVKAFILEAKKAAELINE